MEIITSPYQPAPSIWGRLLVGVAVVAPVTLLVLLPIGFGLQRYVVTGDSMAPAMGRGSILLERRVPVSSLGVGDVITYRPPASAGVEGVITHRIVAIDGDVLRTKGDALPQADPWVFTLDQRPSQPRVLATLPYIGYFYLVLVHPALWAGVAVISLLLLVGPLSRGERRRRADGDQATPLWPMTMVEGARALCSMPWRNEFWWSRTRRTSLSPSSARWSERDTTSTGSTAGRRRWTPSPAIRPRSSSSTSGSPTSTGSRYVGVPARQGTEGRS
jgi:signal peptidase I